MHTQSTIISDIMELNKNNTDAPDERSGDLERVFGVGAERLINQIAYENPSLSPEEVVEYAWSLIPEATAYMQPASPADLAQNAINIHEGYEAHRRVQDETTE